MNAVALLPRIIRFLGMSRSGPGEANCPHCGAKGSVIHSFETDDGARRGAMSGCIQLFPVAPIAREELRLQKKAEEHARGKGSALNRWDLAAQAAIDAFRAGEMTEADAMRRVENERKSAALWRRSRYSR